MLPVIVDEFIDNKRSGEMKGPRRRSLVFRGCGSIAHDATTGRTRTSINNVQDMVKSQQAILGQKLMITFRESREGDDLR